jgi:nitroreductase
MGEMQMDALEALMTRRSVRAYTSERVSDDQMRKILAAGMQAPSANNRQPWHFVVVRQRERLDALAEVLPFGKMLGQAPLGIVVCADSGLQPIAGYWAQDCAAATQNILLACHALGLGAVWIGVYPRDERMTALRELLSLPASVTPLCAIAVGRPAEPVAPVDRFSPQRIHEERW